MLIPLWGELAIRWYGLSYLAGFLAAYLILNHWGKQGTFALQGEKLQNLIVAIIIGVMLGGRIGHILFYDLDSFLARPVMIVEVWKGGMASHGGMIGLTLAALWFARRNRVPFLHLTDHLATVGTLGILFGRIANFINGELWGRITTVRWGVVFPQEAGLDPVAPQTRSHALWLIEQGYLHPRHPSQLYEALLEGLLLFVALVLIRRTAWGKVNGRLSAMFLILYAAGRFAVEFVREPEIVHFGWLTQGQLLSLLLVIPAVIVLVRVRNNRA